MRTLLVILLPLGGLAGCNVATMDCPECRMPEPPTMEPEVMEPVEEPPASDDRTAREIFDTQVAPLLDERCSTCHVTGPGAMFIRPAPATYEAVVAFPALVNFDAVEDSRLLSKGPHSSTTFWTPGEAALVREWIVADAEERALVAPEEVTYETGRVPCDGPAVMDLAVAHVPGATLTFICEPTGAGVVLSDVRILAGRAGARIQHPVPVWWQGEVPNPRVDELTGVDLDVRPFSSALVTEFLSFPGVDVERDTFSFYFTFAGPFEGDGTDPADPADPADPTDPMDPFATGCGNVAGFVANAAPQFQSFCTTCHGGTNPMATAAVNMTWMGDMTPEGQLRQCNEILSRVDPVDADASPIFVNPNPGSATLHPFKFSSPILYESFRSRVRLWLDSE